MKNNLLKIWFTSVLAILCAYPAFAVTEAGEIQRKENKPPKTGMFVTNNIADLNLGKDTESTEEDRVEPIDFSADEMINDEKASTVTAVGNVEIKYNNMRLVTDKLVYNQEKDTIVASGKTFLYTPDGAVINSTYVNLADSMSVGDMYNIKALLKDKSTVTAERFRRKDNQTKVLSYASYTACDICEGKSPLWQVNARKVQHNENTKNVNYNDAFVYIKGVPVFYTPFLTHPDPTVKRRSGFLQPTLGSSSFLKAYLQPRYFWAVDDQTNVLFAPIFSSDKGVILAGNYSHYFYNAYTAIDASYLNDNDKNWPENRGHIFANGIYDINNYWRMKYDWKYVSDYIYLKEMSLPYNDNAWLDSSIAFERFSGRDYVSVEAYYYKMLSYNLRRRNINQYRSINNRKPTVVPLIDSEFFTDPSSIGSYFRNRFNTASIYHKNGTNSQRLTAINSWELPYTSRFGEKYRFVTSLKSDIYYINKYSRYSNDDLYTGTTTRFFPQAGLEWRLPFVRATKHTRQIIEPVVVGVAAPNGGNKEDKIPNDDSEDAYFDDTNVLDLDRYAGYDRNDTGSRVSYGLRWSSYGDIFGRTSAFIAQSFEQNRNSYFMNALDSQKRDHTSDYVGRINAEPNKYLDLNYRFRLDKKTLDAKYSELKASVGPSFLRFNASYIFLEGNTHYNDRYSQRKELYTSVKAKLTQFWSVRVYNLQDMTPKSRGSLEHGGSVIYEDECFKVDTTVKKYNSSNPDLDNDYEFGITFFLKTIGSVGS